MRPSRLWPEVHYLVPGGDHEMVRVIRLGSEQQRLCVVSAQGEPASDRTMTILDLIETDESRLWEMARVHPPESLVPGEDYGVRPPAHGVHVSHGARRVSPWSRPEILGWGLVILMSLLALGSAVALVVILWFLGESR